MKFIIDAQLPPVLARLLNDAGHDAKHVEEVGLREAKDAPIWRYALENQAVILTKDEDFAFRVHQSSISPVIVWVRIGNCSKRALLEWFSPLLPKILEAIAQGQRLIEVR